MRITWCLRRFVVDSRRLGRFAKSRLKELHEGKALRTAASLIKAQTTQALLSLMSAPDLSVLAQPKEGALVQCNGTQHARYPRHFHS